ncbi:hypothetical protein CF326_g1938 [Tilletia indica]|nr:hypothetical protein CF326_g1938 [Tilletia indica]
MASHTNTRPWQTSSLPGLPSDLLPLVDVLHGAYINSGRMSEGLARLHSTAGLFKRAASKNDSSGKNTTRSVFHILSAMHHDIKDQLQCTQTKLHSEMEGMRTRIDKEITLAHTSIDRKMEVTVKAVEEALSGCGDDARAELMEAVDSLNACGTVLQRDINSTEEDYMKNLAQTIVSTSWTITRPLPGHMAEHVRVTAQPPQYGSGLHDETIHAGEEGRGSTNIGSGPTPIE